MDIVNKFQETFFDKNRNEKVPNKFLSRILSDINTLIALNEDLLFNFSELEKRAMEMMGRSVDLIYLFNNISLLDSADSKSRQNDQIATQKSIKNHFKKFFCSLNPLTTKLLDFRAELMDLQKRFERVSKMSQNLTECHSKLITLNSNDWKSFRTILTSWEYKESDKTKLIALVQNKIKDISPILDCETKRLREDISKVKTRFKRHSETFKRNFIKSQGKLSRFCFKTFSVEINAEKSAEKINQKSVEKSAEKINQKTVEKTAEKTDQNLNKKSVENLVDFDTFKTERKPNDFTPKKPSKNTEKTPLKNLNDKQTNLIKVEALDKWEFQESGARRNIRNLLATLHSVLWIEVKGKWTEIDLVHLMNSQSIKRYYRRAILILHPDHNSTYGETVRKHSQRTFQALNKAWEAYREKEK